MKKRLKIVLADPIHNYVDGRGTWLIPLNVLNIAANLKHQYGDLVEVHVFKFPDEALDCIEAIKPDLVAVSNYIWNAFLSNRILKYAKEINPDAVAIMGGPNATLYPANMKSFFERFDCDYFIDGDGELPVANIVGELIAGTPPQNLHKQLTVGSLWYLDAATNEAVKKDGINRPKNINQLPSPFLSGLATPFLEAGLSAMIETNRGCPFTCSFCVWGNDSKVNQFDIDRVKAELTAIQEVVSDPLLMINDANFGLFKTRDLEIAKYIRTLKEDHDWPRSIVVNWGQVRSDTTLVVAETLNDVCTLRQASQSFNKDVLDSIKRKNSAPEDFKKVIKYSQEKNIETFGELILMLPNETMDTYLEGLRFSFDVGVDCVNTNQLQLLEGAPLNTDEQRQLHGFKTKWRLLEGTYGIYKGEVAIESEEIVVQTNTFSEVDCMKCRPLNWLIQMSWTMKRHRLLLQILACLKVNPVDFFMRVLDDVDSAPPSVQALIAKFYQDTKGELFDSREALEAHYSSLEIMKELKNGGFKKLNTHYSGLALWINDDFLSYYKQIALNMLKERDTLSTDIVNMIDECIQFMSAITLGVNEFEDIANGKFICSSLKVNWDFAHWKWTSEQLNLPNKLTEIKSHRFKVTDKQTEVLQNYMKRYSGPDVDYLLCKLHEPYYGVERKFLQAIAY